MERKLLNLPKSPLEPLVAKARYRILSYMYMSIYIYDNIHV